MKRRGSLPKSALGAARIIRLGDLPLWLFALLTVAGFNAIALGGLVCMRRFGQSLGLYMVNDNDTVGAIFSAVLVMYAISLGAAGAMGRKAWNSPPESSDQRPRKQ